MLTFIIIALVFIFSVIIHEVSHGLAALRLGDPTAKYMGRLTLNPVKHIDPIGSVLVPLITYFAGGFIFGWAKPVPYNPYNLRDQKYGPALVGVAGPVSNILIALVFGFFLRVLLVTGQVSAVSQSAIGSVFSFAIMINVLLAFFNLIPIPPLDGSKLLFTFLPISEETKLRLEQFGFMFLLLVIYLLSGPISIFLQAVQSLFFRVIVGIQI
ncbi:MAG: site-2 protease family protein [Candidatus Moranbacteria bacterium]|nr:site-2 protease family protein [Candidatus Moranbacteria bacterium]